MTVVTRAHTNSGQTSNTLIHIVLSSNAERNRRALDQAMALKPAALEIGMPFSDPCADSPALFCAGQKALNDGLTLKKLLEAVTALKTDLSNTQTGPLPLILRLYANMAVAPHTTDIYTRAAHAGFTALVIADLPPVMLDMEDDWYKGAQKAALTLGTEGLTQTPTPRSGFLIVDQLTAPDTPSAAPTHLTSPVYYRRHLVCA